ncbi:GyrI-like domain-containing protein [Eubacteriaceae bacterium ES2]|nr:GyrI-like domain-containing protein [Eubacteriaceae bacterium ES2]
MKYEIVHLEEKTLSGISATTGNHDPQMSETIGNLWSTFYQVGITNTIKNKVNPYSIGLYSDYHDDLYTVTVGNEVFKNENFELETKIIPAGNYAKFSVHGNMVSAVANAWEEIWQLDLNRRFTGDFEEYLNSDWENGDIDIYIALCD